MLCCSAHATLVSEKSFDLRHFDVGHTQAQARLSLESVRRERVAKNYTVRVVA